MARQTASTNPYRAKKITAKEFKFSDLRTEDESALHYELRLVKGKYAPNDEIKVFFEKGNVRESVKLGTVSSHETSGIVPLKLPLGFVPKVQVAIVDTKTRVFSALSAKFKLLADEDLNSLLPAKGADIGQELWRLEIDETGPILIFNNREELNFKFRLQSDWAVRGAILPAAIRQILLAIPHSQGEEWTENWTKWLSINDLDADDLIEPDGETEVNEKIDEVVRDFVANSAKFADKLAVQTEREMK